MDVEKTIGEVSDATSKVAGFVMHYGAELTGIADTIRTVIGVLPLDHTDKDRVTTTLDALENAAQRAIAGANALTDEIGQVTVEASDVAKAVADYFATDAGKAAIAEAVKTNAGN